MSSEVETSLTILVEAGLRLPRYGGFVELIKALSIRFSRPTQPRLQRRLPLKQFLKNPHPVSEKNFFDLPVVESAFDQLGSQISRLAVMQKIGNEVHIRKLLVKLHPFVFRPAPVNEFEEIETNTNAIDANQIYDVGDVIDIAIEGRIFFFWTNKNRIDSDHAAACAHHFNLLVADVALDVVVFARVGVRNNHRSGGVFQNVVEAGRVDVRKIENHADSFAFPDQLTSEGRQSFGRRSGGCENAAVPAALLRAWVRPMTRSPNS